MSLTPASSHLPPWSTHLLDCKLVCSHRNAVDKLHGTPQSVKLNTVIYVHDPIAGQRPTQMESSRKVRSESGWLQTWTGHSRDAPLSAGPPLLLLQFAVERTKCHRHGRQLECWSQHSGIVFDSLETITPCRRGFLKININKIHQLLYVLSD